MLNLQKCGQKIENAWCVNRNCTFGRPNEPRDDTANLALKGWEKSPAGSKKYNPADNKVKSAKSFISKNIEAVKGTNLAKTKNPPKEVETGIRYRLVPAQGVSFGAPSRSATPIGLILQNYYGNLWFKERDRQVIERVRQKRMERPKGEKSTRTSRLRRYVEPVRERPMWFMARFKEKAQPHLDTFRLDEAQRKRISYLDKTIKFPPLQCVKNF